MARGRSSSRMHRSPPRASPSPSRPHSAQQPPQTRNIYVQRGGGGSGMLGTMAAVAGGSVLGHGISNYLYGNSTAAPSQPAEAQELAAAANQENNVCAPQLTGYAKCLEANTDTGADSCGWAWDYFLQCRQESRNPIQ